MSKKRCSRCTKKLPANTKHFHKSKSSRDGWNHRCKSCSAQYIRALQKNGTYNSYRAAMERCRNRRHKDYSDYGGRGIEFRLTDWRQLEKELGARPEGYTLERIDVNGHYVVGNVRWASRAEQARNTRRNTLTLDIAKQIRKLHDLGRSPTEIALRFDIQPRNVYNVLNNVTWRIDE